MEQKRNIKEFKELTRKVESTLNDPNINMILEEMPKQCVNLILNKITTSRRKKYSTDVLESIRVSVWDKVTQKLRNEDSGCNNKPDEGFTTLSLMYLEMANDILQESIMKRVFTLASDPNIDKESMAKQIFTAGRA